MRHRLALVLANTALVSVVLVLLAGPLLLGQLLGTAQSGSLGVRDTALPGRELQVVANKTDFSDYATFNPSPMVEPLFYQTSVTFTAFGGQQAAYNGLLTLFNPTDQPLQVQAEVGRLSGETDGATVWLSLTDDKHAAVTLTTDTAKKGATTVQVASTGGFDEGQAVIGRKLVTAVSKGDTVLSLSSPLTQDVAAGEKVYVGAAYFAGQATASVAHTQTITLPPHGRGSITLTVALERGDEQQRIVLPLTISAE